MKGVAAVVVVVVVVPTYNERENIATLVERISQVKPALSNVRVHVLFVDDASPDGTALEVRSQADMHENIHLLERSGKAGLGTAYLDGFREAIDKLDASIFVQIDADLQHPPEKIAALVQALGRANVALGSRYVPGGGTEGMSRRRRMISKGANWLARTILGLKIKDVTTGFKALDRRSVELLLGQRLSSSGFTYQVESVFIFAKKELKIEEVPFVFKQRRRGESKLSTVEIIEFLGRIIALRIRR